MATNIWSSTGSTDGNLASNWSLGVLSSTDTLTFNSTSVINCTFTSSITCTSISVVVAYTGALNDGGMSFVVTGATNIALTTSTFTSTGTWDIRGNWTFSGIGNVFITAGTFTFTTNSATITSNGKSFYSVVFNGSGKTYTLADPMFTNTYTLTAGTLALATYYIYQAGVATTNIWSAAADGNWNVGGNWSLGHVPTAGEDALFNATSIKKCTFDVSPSITNLGIQNNFSGAIDMTGQTITLAGGMHDAGPGAHNYGNGITINGNTSSLWCGTTSDVGDITATSCALNFNGTTGCTWTCNWTPVFKSLTLGAGAIFVLNGSAYYPTIRGATTLITMGNNSQFRPNLSAGFYLLQPTANQTIFSFGTGCTFSGNPPYIAAYSSGLTVTIPECTFGGLGTFIVYTSTFYGATYNLSGNLSIPNGSFTCYRNGGASATPLILNTNDYSISTKQFAYGGNAAGTNSINFGASTISCSSFINSGTLATTTLNFGTSQWTCGGSFTLLSNDTIIPGTSLITFNTAAASVVTSAGKSFYNIIVNNASKAFSFADAPSLHNLTTTAMASYTHVGFVLTSSNNVTFGGVGTINLGNGITMNGASGALTFASTIGTITTTNCTFTFNGTTACTLVANAPFMIPLLILGVSAKLTNSGGSAQEITYNSFNFGNSSTFTASPSVGYIIVSPKVLNFLLVGSSVTLNGSALWIVDYNFTTGSINIPELTYTGSGEWRIGAATSGLLTTNFTGNFVSTAAVRFRCWTNGVATINLNSFNITCTTLTHDCTAGSVTINYGSGNISIATFASSYVAGTYSINFQTSQWTCSGNWTFGSNHTIDVGTTSSITLTSATHTITANGKNFPIVISNGNTTWNSTGTYTIKELQILAGTIQKFQSSITVNITQFTIGTWSGNVSNFVYFRSSIAGTQFIMSIPSGISTSYVDFKDCNFTTNSVTADATCIGQSANNIGIIWHILTNYILFIVPNFK